MKQKVSLMWVVLTRGFYSTKSKQQLDCKAKVRFSRRTEDYCWMSPALFACITLVLAKHATSLGFKRGSITSNVCCLQRCWFAHIVYHAKTGFCR